MAEFFDNHGMYSLRDRPRWRTVGRRLGPLRRGDHRSLARPHPAASAGAAGRAATRPGADRGRRLRDRGLRRGRDRDPLRPGAGDARRPQRGRARGPRRDPLPAQRGRAAHRHLAAAAAPRRLGELELPPHRGAGRGHHRHLLDEQPAAAARRPRVPGDAQPRRGRSTPRRSCTGSPTTTPSTPPRASPPRPATPRSAALRGAPTTAAPTGAGASTRTACVSAAAGLRAGRRCPPPPSPEALAA